MKSAHVKAALTPKPLERAALGKDKNRELVKKFEQSQQPTDKQRETDPALKREARRQEFIKKVQACPADDKSKPAGGANGMLQTGQWDMLSTSG